MEYAKWQNFEKVINAAKAASENSGHMISNDFTKVSKMIRTGDSYKEIIDYELSRYACYLIVQNGDPRKKAIALSKTYIALQTRKQELLNENSALSWFVYSQTEAKIKRENIKDDIEAGEAYHEVNSKVQKAIKDMGGTMPKTTTV